MDGAGNLSTGCTGPVQVTVFTPPAAPVIGAVAPSPLLETDIPLVQGTAEAGSQIRLYIDNACVTSAVGSDSESVFSGAGIPIAPLTPGTYDLFAEAEDAAQHVSNCSSPFTFTVQ